MIDARELRIGNWVQNDAGVKWEFEDFGQLADQFSLYHNTKNRIEAFPIPLTKEILLKCGFERRKVEGFGDNEGKWWLEPYMKTRMLFEYDKQIGNIFYNGMYGIEIKYVHQLQNLYYALTNSELNIKI